MIVFELGILKSSGKGYFFSVYSIKFSCLECKDNGFSHWLYEKNLFFDEYYKAVLRHGDNRGGIDGVIFRFVELQCKPSAEQARLFC